MRSCTFFPCIVAFLTDIRLAFRSCASLSNQQIHYYWSQFQSNIYLMQRFPFFHNLANLLFSEIVIVSSNSVCNHTRDEQIALSLRGRPILSLVWLQTELDSTQSHRHHILFRLVLKITEFHDLLFLVANWFPCGHQLHFKAFPLFHRLNWRSLHCC